MQTNKQTDFANQGDTISRQAAIDALDGNVIVTSRESAQAVMDYIRGCADRMRSLPSAQPDLTLESAIDYLHSIGWMQNHDKEITNSAYTEGYTAAESKYRKMWDEMQSTKQDAVEDTWDLFQMISSAWYGKGCYFKQNDGSVYSRLSCKYMTFEDAVREFMEKIDND